MSCSLVALSSSHPVQQLVLFVLLVIHLFLEILPIVVSVLFLLVLFVITSLCSLVTCSCFSLNFFFACLRKPANFSSRYIYFFLWCCQILLQFSSLLSFLSQSVSLYLKFTNLLSCCCCFLLFRVDTRNYLYIRISVMCGRCILSSP